MSDRIFTIHELTNLTGALPPVKTLSGLIMTGDNVANQIIVEVHKDGEKVVLQQDVKVLGIFARPDGKTVEADGEVTEDGNAKVIFPDAVYDIDGTLLITVRIMEDPIIADDNDQEILDWNKKVTIAICSCSIKATDTGVILNPDGTIKSMNLTNDYFFTIHEQINQIPIYPTKRTLDHSETDSIHKILIENYNGKNKINFSEDIIIVGYFTLSNGSMIESDALIVDGNAEISFPIEVYEIEGALSITVKFFGNLYTLDDVGTELVSYSCTMSLVKEEIEQEELIDEEEPEPEDDEEEESIYENPATGEDEEPTEDEYDYGD